MADKKASESVFNIAVDFEEKLVEVKDEAQKQAINKKIEYLFDLAIKLEEHEVEMEKIAEEVEYTTYDIFSNLTLKEKNELRDQMQDNLTTARSIFKEKGDKGKENIENKSKEIISEVTEKTSNWYDNAIDFCSEKISDIKEKLALRKEEKRQAKEEAYKQLKAIGKDKSFDEEYGLYDKEAREVEQDIEKAEFERKNIKALAKYEKKGFFSRFISHYAELDKKPELTEEQKVDFEKNGGELKKMSFFAKVKEAFSKTMEEKVDPTTREVKEDSIMQEYENKIEQKNAEISELENILFENEEQKNALIKERDEKLVEVVKAGKLKAKELQEIIDQEMILCSNPKLIVAKAKASKLKDKLSRIWEWGKAKVNSLIQEEPEMEELEVEQQDVEEDKPKAVSRNSGMDR